MKIAYLYILMKNSSIGVLNKIEQQADALTAMGEDRMDILVLNPDREEVKGHLHYIKTRTVLPSPFNSLEYLFRKRHLIERSADLSSYDRIVLRYTFSDATMNQFVENHNVIAELHTPIIDELESKIPKSLFSFQGIGRRLRLAVEKKNLFPTLQKCKGMVTMGGHLDEYYSSHLHPKIPSRVITNGFDPARIGQFGFKPFDGKNLHLVLVASRPEPWFGIDRLIRSVVNYMAAGSTVEITVHLVGRMSADQFPEAVSNAGMFVFHGVRTGPELDAIMAKANLGVAAIAMQRKNLDRNSSIKTVEYTFRGLPFVLGYEDAGFSDIGTEQNFMLRIPATEEDVDMDRVIRFAQNMTDKRESVLTFMRSYAEKNLTWSSKLSEYFEFIRSIDTRK